MVANARTTFARRGFTVVEIAIVVVIVVIIVALAVPQLQKARQHASRASPTKDELGTLLQASVPGKILFNPPSSMTQGSEVRMTVRISKHPLEDLAAGLPPGRNTLLDQIAVLPFMTVKLTGGKAFEIRPLEPENQFVSTDRATEWNFDVKAVRAGEQNLDLVVGVRVKLSKGGEETRFYPLYTRNVKVTVNVWYSTKQFLTDHWEVIMTAIVLPVIAYWWKQRKKKPSSDLAEP